MNNPFEPTGQAGPGHKLSGTRKRIALIACIVLMMAASVAWACGPNFPSSVLTNGNDVLSAPVGDLGVELSHIQSANETAVGTFKADLPESEHGRAQQTLAVGLAELQAALKARGDSAPQQQQTINTWRAYRKGMDLRREKAKTREPIDSDLAVLHVQPGPDLPALDSLPVEFALYLRGAAAYVIGDMAEAQSQWAKLLALPENQRHFRSTWAAYMTGRSYLTTQPKQAILWFKRTRKLATDGLADATGLASASLGWEARANLDQHGAHQAIKLYMAQWRSGDTRLQTSIAVAVRQALRGNDTQLEAIAKDRTARQVVTAWFVANGGVNFLVPRPNTALKLRWLAIMEKVDAKNSLGAERLAWMAYQAGVYDIAARWLERAPKDAPIALWINAKLLMRQGKRDQAVVQLAKAIRSFPDREIWPDSSWRDRTIDGPGSVRPKAQASAELGVLKLSQGQFVEALDALLDANDWMDAAYIAQSILNIDELKSYVDHLKPGLRISKPLAVDFGGVDDVNAALVDLLARRLTLDGRFAQARAYFKPEMKRVLDQYTKNLRLAHDASQPQAVRAEAYWQAALICRHKGMELMGTELSPDCVIFAGNFELGLSMDRLAISPKKCPLVAPTQEESDRYDRHQVVPVKRWHYRYKALDLAWSALALMPDESDLTARRFIIAGSWVKARDPKAVDRFYKALVVRCGHTKLGRQADKRRWFPPLPETGKLQ